MPTQSTRKIKVLHIVDSLGVGGVEMWLAALLRYWRTVGGNAPQFDFLVLGGKPDVLDDEVRALGGQIIYQRYGRSNLFSFTREFRRLLRNRRYDAIHDHQGGASGWHFLLGLGYLPAIRITHVHNTFIEITNRGVSRRLIAAVGLALVSRLATHILGTSRQLIGDYGFDAPRYSHIPRSVLHCGFDTARFHGDAPLTKASVCGEFGWPEDVKIVLFVGRMDASPDFDHPFNLKNSGFAVSLGIAAAQQNPQICLLLAGAPSAAVPLLEQRIAAAGLSDRIRFIGVRRDVERLMLASDVLLFPSRAEGLGMAAVEAQAAGLPVLASTAVSREAIVIPELYRALALSESFECWTAALLAAAGNRPPPSEAYRLALENSDFSIQNSARRLMDIYTLVAR